MTRQTDAAVTVEFLGLAELRAGCRCLQAKASSVSELLGVLEREVPPFVERAKDGQPQLRSSWILNVNGDRFVKGSHQPLHDGDVVLVLSVDAGG